MSKKRSQRKNSNYNYRPGQKAGEDPQALQENSRTKKFSPAARNLLFVDLIFLAVCQMMESGGLLDDVLSAWLTLVGLILLLVAVGIQFQFWRGSPRHTPAGGTPVRPAAFRKPPGGRAPARSPTGWLRPPSPDGR